MFKPARNLKAIIAAVTFFLFPSSSFAASVSDDISLAAVFEEFLTIDIAEALLADDRLWLEEIINEPESQPSDGEARAGQNDLPREVSLGKGPYFSSGAYIWQDGQYQSLGSLSWAWDASQSGDAGSGTVTQVSPVGAAQGGATPEVVYTTLPTGWRVQAGGSRVQPPNNYITPPSLPEEQGPINSEDIAPVPGEQGQINSEDIASVPDEQGQINSEDIAPGPSSPETAMPEPSSLLLLGSTFAISAWRRRLRRRA